MARRFRIFALLLLAAAALTVPALADSGPKPLLSITVEHPPEAPYYLDLLAEGPPYDDGYRTEEDFAGYDQPLLQAMRDAVPEGWHLCILDGDLIFGDLTGEPQGGRHDPHIQLLRRAGHLPHPDRRRERCGLGL